MISLIFFISLKKWDNFDITNIKQSIVIIKTNKTDNSFQNNPWWIIKTIDNKSWLGFIATNSWDIITVNHILPDSQNIYNILYNNKTYSAKIIKRNKKQDLAYLKIINTNKKFKFLKINKNTINQNIYSVWLDNNSIIISKWRIVSKNNTIWKMNNLIEISNNLKPWYSGWVILNNNWKIIWLNYATYKNKSYWVLLNNP
jgi:hypothetical protein